MIIAHAAVYLAAVYIAVFTISDCVVLLFSLFGKSKFQTFGILNKEHLYNILGILALALVAHCIGV